MHRARSCNSVSRYDEHRVSRAREVYHLGMHVLGGSRSASAERDRKMDHEEQKAEERIWHGGGNVWDVRQTQFLPA